MNFFFTKIDIICKAITGPFASVVQAYTQPYSFGGKIKVIICQIRHELSVNIYEISTSWKTTLDGGPYVSFAYISSYHIENNIQYGKFKHKFNFKKLPLA